jgi:hypothetical protein
LSWKLWLSRRDAVSHTTSKAELDNLRALIARDLKDAAIAGLSADRRFATAYNAALQSARMAASCAGYRITARAGHHQLTFESIVLAMGVRAQRFADYFETCRRKRNVIDYTFSNVASNTEADELLRETHLFYETVEAWITGKFPALAR